jgi:hypothetical protein
MKPRDDDDLASGHFIDKWLERERRNYLARKPKATIAAFRQHVFKALKDDPEQMERLAKQVFDELYDEIKTKQQH